MRTNHEYFVLSILFFARGILARDPFTFDQAVVLVLPKACKPILQSITSYKGVFSALISCEKKPFIVQRGQIVDQWRVDEITSSYVVLTQKGNRNKAILEI